MGKIPQKTEKKTGPPTEKPIYVDNKQKLS